MKQSLRTFMNGIVDYAGLFPPAGLELEPALRNYLRYREGEDAWMLSRFILPYTMLERLEAWDGEIRETGRAVDLSVLGGSADTVAEFGEMAEKLTGTVNRFHESHEGLATTRMLEIRLPREAVLASDHGRLKKVMDRLAETLAGDPRLPEYVFFEAPLEESWKKDLLTVMEALQAHNNDTAAGLERYRYAGFKLRCGGTEAEDFPSTEQVAWALNRAREHSLAVKCTAGLHHPVRHYADSVGTRMHGFLNVFGGAMIAWAHDLNDEELDAIVREEDPEQFHFGEEALTWREHSVFTGEIAELREVSLVSFGSCSFDEPREDLRGLDLL
ncbi:MAG: hypothetical protein U5K31_07370 [Balneolaceae bacterium]|nr:hypothetical protein [Balneolaceae bacterium]